MAGATIKEIQELAGHKTMKMSARYSHLITSSLCLTGSQEQPLRTPTATKTATSQEQPLARGGVKVA
jgi:hypothetical protein